VAFFYAEISAILRLNIYVDSSVIIIKLM